MRVRTLIPAALILLACRNAVQEGEPFKLNGIELRLVVIHTEAKRGTFLATADAVPEGKGTLIVHARPLHLHLRGTKTRATFDVAFIREDRTVSETHTLFVGREKWITSSEEVSMALFLPRGWCLKHKIQAGHKLEGPKSFETLQPEKRTALNGRELSLEVIHTEASRRTFLATADALPEGNGYLIIHARPRHLHLHGTDTKASFNVAFLTGDGAVSETYTLFKGNEKGITSSKEVTMALFLPRGWCRKNKITAGQKLEWPKSINTIQPEERTILKIGDKKLFVEVSYTSVQRSRGLMHRTIMSADDGMLFMYPREAPHSYWMQNTRIPLTLAYLKADGKISQLVDMKPMTEESYPSREEIMFVLEMNKGWFEKNGVREGARVEIPEDVQKLKAE